MEDRAYLEERKDFAKQGVSGHSSLLAFYPSGERAFRQTDAPCYSAVNYCAKPLSNVFLFFPSASKGQRQWLDWVINRSPFSKAFLTKDVEEGLALGFELNPNCEHNLMRAGGMSLRTTHEFSEFAFSKVLELGFSEEESFAFCCNFSISKNSVVSIRRGNNNHWAMGRKLPWSTYLGKNIQPQGKIYTLKSPPKSEDRVPLLTYFGAMTAKHNIDSVVGGKLSKEMVNDFLKKIKKGEE